MKKNLDWRVVDRHELAELLCAAPTVSSRAVGAATIYNIEEKGRAVLAVALPDGQAVIVAPAAATKQRRHEDAHGSIPP